MKASIGRRKLLGVGITDVLRKAETKAFSKQNKAKSFDEIPGPSSMPFVGNMWRYLPIIGQYSHERLHRTYERMFNQYGYLIKEKMFGKRVLVHVFHPDDMRTVYQNEGKKPIRLSHRVVAMYRKTRPHLYSGPGLFPANGEEWYRYRQLFQRLLLDPKTAESGMSRFEEVTEDLLEQIPNLLDDKGEADLLAYLYNWALESIGAVALNRRLGCLSPQGNPDAQAMIDATHNTHKMVLISENVPILLNTWLPPFKRLQTAQDALSDAVDRYMRDAMEELKTEEKDSVLAKLLKIENASTKDVFTMIADMFIAGIDTTAYALSFCLYNLAKNKDVQDKLRKELVEHLPEQTTRFCDKRPRIRYLNYVIKETLRVNPISIGTGRILPVPVVLHGYHVPAGVMVVLHHQWASMQDKFFKDAKRFWPERWSPELHEICAPPLISSPFGYGPRLCIGMRFARRELVVVLARLMRRFQFDYHYEDIDLVNRLTNVPDRPMKLRLTRLDY